MRQVQVLVGTNCFGKVGVEPGISLVGGLRDGGGGWVGQCPTPPPPFPWGCDNSGSLGDSLSSLCFLLAGAHHQFRE